MPRCDLIQQGAALPALPDPAFQTGDLFVVTAATPETWQVAENNLGVQSWVQTGPAPAQTLICTQFTNMVFIPGAPASGIVDVVGRTRDAAGAFIPSTVYFTVETALGLIVSVAPGIGTLGPVVNDGAGGALWTVRSDPAGEFSVTVTASVASAAAWTLTAEKGYLADATAFP